jgi:hypothetical protein
MGVVQSVEIAAEMRNRTGMAKAAEIRFSAYIIISSWRKEGR